MRAKKRSKQAPVTHATGPSSRRREPILAQLAGFVDLFVWLLVLKTFFLPLFVIPTGSMAETLKGAHATHTCPSCGNEYTVGFHDGTPGPVIQCPNCRYREFSGDPTCPRCLQTSIQGRDGMLVCQNLKCPARYISVPDDHDARSITRCPVCRQPSVRPVEGRDDVVACQFRDCPTRFHVSVDNLWPATPIKSEAGDRIVVHGWPFDIGGALRPQRWEVVVFKVPKDGQTNYIKRLIGLPGETIEIIDGDVFVTEPGARVAHVARKTPHAQESLWFPYYDHDQRPRRQSIASAYEPRWTTLPDSGGWTGLETRTLRFDGLELPHSPIQFATAPGNDAAQGEITDVYGYNGPGRGQKNFVSDVRLSAEVTIESGDGYVELSTTKLADGFHARLYADGRVTLEHVGRGGSARTFWGEAYLDSSPTSVRFALANVDYQVTVEVDGKPLIRTTPTQYDITREQALLNAVLSPTLRVPCLRIAAERVQASLGHVLIERDVFYTCPQITYVNERTGEPEKQVAGHGIAGNPITLGDEYFVMGDNSPASLDSRLWKPEELGPHLREAYRAGEYHVGTVPADQMIGQAFFVYWPGFLPLYPGGPNFLPDLGRVRWIH